MELLLLFNEPKQVINTLISCGNPINILGAYVCIFLTKNKLASAEDYIPVIYKVYGSFYTEEMAYTLIGELEPNMRILIITTMLNSLEDYDIEEMNRTTKFICNHFISQSLGNDLERVTKRITNPTIKALLEVHSLKASDDEKQNDKEKQKLLQRLISIEILNLNSSLYEILKNDKDSDFSIIQHKEYFVHCYEIMMCTTPVDVVQKAVQFNFIPTELNYKNIVQVFNEWKDVEFDEEGKKAECEGKYRKLTRCLVLGKILHNLNKLALTTERERCRTLLKLTLAMISLFRGQYPPLFKQLVNSCKNTLQNE